VELSWSTFALEVINFLVLVWILKHFLYQPVLDIVSKRRQSIDATLQDARRQLDEANVRKGEYENRLADWEKERQQLRDNLAEELEKERTRQLKSLQEQLQAEQEKARVTEAQRRIDATRQTELQALRQAADFASRLLRQGAGPGLEARLLKLLVADLNGLSDKQKSNLKSQWGESPQSIDIVSAFPLTDEQKQRLEEALTAVTGLSLPASYRHDPELLAGLRITIGAWVLHTSLRDELKGFAEFAHVTR